MNRKQEYHGAFRGIGDIRDLDPLKAKVYRAWTGMKNRCTNPSNKDFGKYGGRGITVSDEWMHSFSAFFYDMGLPPSLKHSLDRRDVNGPYSKSNCRWATLKTQANNKRINKHLTFNGKTQTISEWACEIGIEVHALYYRIKSCWSVDRILNTKTPRQRYHAK